MEREEDCLLPFVQVGHGGEQRADHEVGAVIPHPVEFVAAAFNRVEHAIDDRGDARLEPRQAARRECGHQQPANPRVALAVHLGDELHAHELVELLEAVAARQLRGEPLGVGEDFLHIGVAAAHDLRRPGGQHIEGRAPRPLRHDAARVLSKRAAAEVDVHDLARVEFGQH